MKNSICYIGVALLLVLIVPISAIAQSPDDPSSDHSTVNVKREREAGKERIVINGSPGEWFDKIERLDQRPCRVAYVGTTGKNRSVLVVDGIAVLLADDKYDVWNHFEFSPDGTRYAYRFKTGKRRRIIVDNQLVAMEGRPVELDWIVFTFSSDGRHIAFWGTSGRDTKVFLDGDLKYVHKGIQGLEHFRLSQDGAHLAYAMQNRKDEALIVDGQMVYTCNDFTGSWFNPQGTAIAFCCHEGKNGDRFSLLDIASHTILKDWQIDGYVETTVFSSDGQHLAWISNREGIGFRALFLDGRRMSTARGSLVSGYVVPGHVMFSRDGSRLVYVCEQSDPLPTPEHAQLSLVEYIERYDRKCSVILVNGFPFEWVAGTGWDFQKLSYLLEMPPRLYEAYTHVACLDDCPPEKLEAVINGVMEYGVDCLEPLVSRLHVRRTSNNAAAVLARLSGQETSKRLIAELENPNNSIEMRARIASILHKRDAANDPLLLPLVRQQVDFLSATPMWSAPAAEALACIGEPAVPTLIQLLRNSPSERTRCYAAIILGLMGKQAKSAIPDLIAIWPEFTTTQFYSKPDKPGEESWVRPKKTYYDEAAMASSPFRNSFVHNVYAEYSPMAEILSVKGELVHKGVVVQSGTGYEQLFPDREDFIFYEMAIVIRVEGARYALRKITGQDFDTKSRWLEWYGNNRPPQ